jgi:tetratricopeptide (TPR) repeat protein
MTRQEMWREPPRASLATAAPGVVKTLRERAITLYQGGNRAEAMQICRQILAISPKLADVLAFAGLIAMDLGNAEEAASFYEAAVVAKRNFAEAHYNLGNALMQLGRKGAAIEAYRRAARHRPDLLPAHNNLGNALQSLGRWREAAQAYRRALAIDPGIAELHRNLGIVLQQEGQVEEALPAYRRALALKPGWSQAFSNIANLLLEQNEPKAVVETCDRWLGACPGTIEAIGLKSVALDQLGDRAGAAYLVDLNRFVRIERFDRPPEGYVSMAAFNAALATHALEHPTLTLPDPADPRYHCPTLRITGEFLAEPKGPAVALEAMINRATANYLAGLAAQTDRHPFVVKPPRHWRLTSWAAVLDRQGNLSPHIHYDGYVSGVYYCRLPDLVTAAGEGEAGWFELGRLPDRFGAAIASEVGAIQPQEGMMILFPSYFYHRTVPFAAPQLRISIAFDAMPVD